MNMSQETIDCIYNLARKAAYADLRDEREFSQERASWWVGELSYKLGIVDSHGMIDVGGTVAREFKKAYLHYQNKR